MLQTPRLDALTVLVVDDSKHMCELIATMLRAFGVANITLCHDTDAALAVLRKHSIDVIITDLALPPVDGVRFVQSLRWDSHSPAPFTPILMITGYSDRARVEAARTPDPETHVADDSAVSADDEDIEALGEVGIPVVERILGGTIIKDELS